MNIRTADILFTCNEGSLVTEGIQFFQRGGDSCPYTHVALIEQWPMIISADADGLQHREITKDECIKFTVLTCPMATDAHRMRMIEGAFKDVGRGVKYDFASIRNLALHLPVRIDPSTVYCSEDIFLRYGQEGLWLLKRSPILVTPRDLYHSSILEEVPYK